MWAFPWQASCTPADPAARPTENERKTASQATQALIDISVYTKTPYRQEVLKCCSEGTRRRLTEHHRTCTAHVRLTWVNPP